MTELFDEVPHHTLGCWDERALGNMIGGDLTHHLPLAPGLLLKQLLLRRARRKASREETGRLSSPGWPRGRHVGHPTHPRRAPNPCRGFSIHAKAPSLWGPHPRGAPYPCRGPPCTQGTHPLMASHPCGAPIHVGPTSTLSTAEPLATGGKERNRIPVSVQSSSMFLCLAHRWAVNISCESITYAIL